MTYSIEKRAALISAEISTLHEVYHKYIEWLVSGNHHSSVSGYRILVGVLMREIWPHFIYFASKRFDWDAEVSLEEQELEMRHALLFFDFLNLKGPKGIALAEIEKDAAKLQKAKQFIEGFPEEIQKLKERHRYDWRNA